MVATCYTLRPGPESGWVTFFELGRGVAFQGFFLILGPATPAGSRADPEARQEAQTVARAIVAAWKNRAGADLAEWLGGLSRLVGLAARPVEYGAVILKGEDIYFLCEGRVRVFPLTSAARHRWEGDIPGSGRIESRRVEIGDRFFFGRLPDGHLRGLPATDALERVEQAGGQDGALILTFLPGGASSEPGATPRTAPMPVRPPTAEPAAPASATVTPIETARRLGPMAPLAEPPIVVTPRPSIVTATPTPAGSADNPAANAPPEPVTMTSSGERPRSHPWPWFAATIGVLALGVYFLVLRPRMEPAAPGDQVVDLGGAPPAESSRRDVSAPLGSPDTSMSGGQAGIAWEMTLGGAITGSPLVLSDRVIVTARDGTIAALARHDGHTIWSQRSQKGFGGGAIHTDSLVAVAGFDGIVRLLAPADGREVSRLVTNSRIASPPARTTEGLIVAGAYDRTLHALDPATGRSPWKARLGGILWATPGVGRKYLYAPGLDGVMTAVNSQWGSVLWRFRSGGEIYSSPAVTEAEVVFGCEDGSIYSLSAGEGALRWRTPVGRPVSGGVCIQDDRVLVGDDGGILHALDRADGREVWRYAAGGAIKSTPLVDNGTVLLSAHDGALHALDLATGSRIGRYPIGSPIAAAPALSGDTLFVGTHDGRLVALRLR